MEIHFAKVDKSSKHLSTQSMIGIRPINYIERARKCTINNVNSRCIKQSSIFTAIPLSQNIPASKKASCAVL